MKSLAILETSPKGPLPLHEAFHDHPDADFFYVSHDEECEGGLFNPDSSWAGNRNLLWDKLPRRYDWYMFTDYDVEFTPADPIPELLRGLKILNPAVAFTWYLKDGPAAERDFSSGLFGNNMAIVFHWSVAPLLFPLPQQFGGFWDAASYVNVIAALAWPQHVARFHNITSRSLVSSDYASNVNAAVGKADMQKCYEWQKSWILMQGLPNSIHDFKRAARADAPRILGSPATVNYSDVRRLGQLFDLTHPHWRNILWPPDSNQLSS